MEELSSSSDESSSDERTYHVKCTDFVKNIDEMDDGVFKSHMRIKRSTANYLIRKNLFNLYKSFYCNPNFLQNDSHKAHMD